MDTYSVEIRNGCTIMRGSVPIAHFAALAKTGSRDDVIDVDLARRLDASFVFGHPRDLVELGKNAPAVKLPAAAAKLSAEARAWLETGERGASSEALFDATLDCTVAVGPGGNKRAHPHDPADLLRCIKMLDAVPEARASLFLAAELSPEWSRLVDHWAVFSEMRKREICAPKNNGRAPETYALKQSILNADFLTPQAE